jgi:tetratricopeptide (TPR) repeat protein
MTRGLLLLALLPGACSGAAADHERLGDRAYREGRYPAAMAEYDAAAKHHGGARLLAKLGSAALHDGEIAKAIEAFTALKAVDGSRAAEAAAGLERAAELAARGGRAQVANLAAAVRALRVVAPGRPLGRFDLAQAVALDPSEALLALPAAFASASNGRMVDSLLVAYGEAERVTTACEAATHTFGAVLRRTRDGGLRATAAQGVGACALRLGLDALSAEQQEAAEQWFEKVRIAAPATPLAWRAAIGLGDARLKQGDALGAAVAYQSVLSAGSVPDSLLKLATEKLNALSTAPPVSPTAKPQISQIAQIETYAG